MRYSIFLFFFASAAFTSLAAEVDTVRIFSKAMQRTYKAVVVKPASYKKAGSRFETVYLLHGHGGSFSNWIKLVPQLKKYADDYQLLIVCPEGKAESWYLNSPLSDSMQFETYIAKEVPAFIDAQYKTIAQRKARAITGLSMGGHGGLFLGFRHQDIFSACGSMSGALLLRSITDKRYGIEKLLGDSTQLQAYYDNSIMKQLDLKNKDSLAIMIDCGTEDFIVGMSRAVHARMLELKVPHDYIERPGRHDWNYWRTAVQYQLLFFRNYFDSQKRLASSPK